METDIRKIVYLTGSVYPQDKMARNLCDEKITTFFPCGRSKLSRFVRVLYLVTMHRHNNGRDGDDDVNPQTDYGRNCRKLRSHFERDHRIIEEISVGAPYRQDV